MVFGTNSMLKKAKLPTVLLNISLQYVNSFNYLGIKLDNKLNFETHALECARQVSHKIYMLTKIRSLLNNTQSLYIYKSKILPYFNFTEIFSIIKHSTEPSQNYKNCKIEPLNYA